MSSGSGVVVRVTIPMNLRKTIQDIKEIAGKHSDEDIYAMLKECNMDPNETAQKLLYLDTFHEVKRKRDRKQANASTRAPQRYRWTSGVQRHGVGSRGRNSSTYVSDDTGDRRKVSARDDNGVTNYVERSSNHPVPVQHNTAAVQSKISSNGSAIGSVALSNGVSAQERNLKVSADKATDGNQGKRPIPPTVDIKQIQTLNAGPTTAPTPAVVPGASFEGRDSGVYCSASDPVLVPSLNPRTPSAVGAIKRETGSQRTAPDFIGTSLSESRLNASRQDVANNSQVAQRTMISANKTSQGIERNQNSEESRQSSALSHDTSSAPIMNQDSWSAQQVNGASKLMASEGETVALRANGQSVPKVEDATLELPPSQLDMKLEKLNLSTHQPVIFPEHIQVPEAYRSGLTFGSLDDTLVHSKTDNQERKHVDGTVLTDENAARKSSPRHQSTSSITHEGDYSGHVQSRPHVPENSSPLKVNVASDIPLKADQLKPELLQPIGGYPFLHTAPGYSFGLVPPPPGAHLLQVEGAEVGNSAIPSTSGSSQPPTQTVGVGQTSITVPPQLLPFLRQPYPSNYYTYPYFPQIYMPPNAYQFLGHGGFPQQASTGSIYMSPPAATGAKFPIPPQYKPGSVPANMTPYGIPTGYGSYGSPAVGYGFSAQMTPGTSANNEDLTATELKENNIHPTVKQNEDSQVWISPPGHDSAAMPANFFYNLNYPQGQQLAFSPAHSGQGSLAGMYHLAQTTAAPSVVQALPQHSQTMAPSVESVVPPSGTYQQPHSQLNWNPKLLNRENI